MEMTRNPEGRWKTQDELDFIDRLGTHRPDYVYPGEVRGDQRIRRELLERYLEACGNRRDWGEVEHDVVEAHAHLLLINADDSWRWCW